MRREEAVREKKKKGGERCHCAEASIARMNLKKASLSCLSIVHRSLSEGKKGTSGGKEER